MLKNPIALVLFLVSLGLFILDRIFQKSRGFVTIFSAFIALAAVGMDLMSGASLRECVYLLIVVLLMNMSLREKEVSDEL